MKHTPGPWTVSGNLVKYVHDDEEVVQITEYKTLTPRQAANAQLIAAAPDLLDALKRILACYSTSHSPELRQECWEQVRAAIAKATGEQQ